MPLRKFESFNYKTLNHLKIKIKELNLNIPINPEIEILQQRVKFKDKFIPNRLAIQPMEGYDAKLDGSPSSLTHRRYMRYARGGCGLIWFEATAISEDCRSNQHQLYLSEDNNSEFKKLVIEVRENCNKTLRSLGFKNQCFLILQLNHSGRYSKNKNQPYPIRAYSNRKLDDAKNISEKEGKIISDEELEELEDIWVNKIKLAYEIGFDGVDTKACHGYLIHELLCARNRKNSKYGGKNLLNRSRFLFNIIKKTSKVLSNSSEFYITPRLSIYDGIPYPNGFGVKVLKQDNFPAVVDLSEPLKIIKMLYSNGVKLINITIGNPHYKAHLTRPYDVPIQGYSPPNEHPLISVNRLLNLTAEIKKNIPKDIVIVGSGYSYLRQYAGYVAAALIHENKVDICGFGRMAFANPDFPKQIFEKGEIDKKKVCITCSKCSGLMRLGKKTGCVIRDIKYQKTNELL
ncbi:MAG: oxidoreductase [Promethearchaeota archaeon]